MNPNVYYLIKLAEEASEVAKEALKTAQFGPLESMAGTGVDNYSRLRLELADLCACIEVLNERFGLDFIAHTRNSVISDHILNTKINKMEKWYKHSVECHANPSFWPDTDNDESKE